MALYRSNKVIDVKDRREVGLSWDGQANPGSVQYELAQIPTLSSENKQFIEDTVTYIYNYPLQERQQRINQSYSILAQIQDPEAQDLIQRLSALDRDKTQLSTDDYEFALNSYYGAAIYEPRLGMTYGQWGVKYMDSVNKLPELAEQQKTGSVVQVAPSEPDPGMVQSQPAGNQFNQQPDTFFQEPVPTLKSWWEELWK